MRKLSAFIAAPILVCAAFFLTQVPAGAAPTPSPDNAAAVKAYARVLHSINPHLPSWQSSNLAKHVLVNARRWRIDANLLVALVTVESSWHTSARSYAGAMGLGQLMPGTARTLRVNPLDPYQNLQGSARYLHAMLNKFHNSPHQFSLAFAAYNAGPLAVTAYGGIPPYSETQHYVVKVMRTWKAISRKVKLLPQVIRRKIYMAESPDLSFWIGSTR